MSTPNHQPDDGLAPLPDLPDIDPARDRDDDLYDLEFNDDTVKQDEDPDAIPSLFP